METEPKSFSVAVCERTIHGITAWFARCLVPDCEWIGRGRTAERFAANDARQHGAKHAKGECK